MLCQCTTECLFQFLILLFHIFSDLKILKIIAPIVIQGVILYNTLNWIIGTNFKNTGANHVSSHNKRRGEKTQLGPT